MSRWLNNLQPASFRDVRFEVLSIEDRDDKALVEHGKPFANGVDLEDMGTLGHSVQISAVFYGAGFDTKLISLMNALKEQGASVLVHPIFGRMQNMIATGWSFRVTAEDVNYVALDMGFKEATESQPIFVFENEWLAKLEQLQNTLDEYQDKILGYLDIITNTQGIVSGLFGSALGIYSAIQGVFSGVRRAFDLDSIRFPSGGGYSSNSYTASNKTQAKLQNDMLYEGFGEEINVGKDGGLSPKQRFDNLSSKSKEIKEIPSDLVTGKNETADNKRTHKINELQMKPVNIILQLQVITNIVYWSSDLIENEGENMNAVELMQVNRQVRMSLQSVIDLLRQLQAFARQKGDISVDAIYTESENMIEGLRDMASYFNGLVVATINKKPPLIVRQAEFDGTMHQFSHLFYSDIKRTPELIRLNPHLTHPAFIKCGDWINCYAQ